MASTNKLNDECYFKTLCAESKGPGNYVLYNGASTNNNKCYPRETPSNTKMNYKNVNIESNLFNITSKSSKCLDGNTLSDKRKNINNNDMQKNDCTNNIGTEFTRSNLNIINREIYNYSDGGSCSWYEFACEIKNQLGFKAQIDPVSTFEFNQLAKRPNYSVLDKSKIKSKLDIKIINWKDSLNHFFLNNIL